MGHDVRGFFDGYAETFDDIYESGLKARRPTLSRILRRSMKLRFELTFDLCRPLDGHSFLDLGCGAGQYAIFAAAHGAAKVTGVDFATEMIELATHKARELGLEDRCEYRLDDITKVDDLGAHDYCVALGVFDYIENAAPLLRRMQKLTRIRLVASFPKRWHWLTPQRKLRYRLRRCPLWFYGRSDLDELATGLAPLVTHVFDLGRDYLLTAAAP